MKAESGLNVRAECYPSVEVPGICQLLCDLVAGFTRVVHRLDLLEGLLGLLEPLCELLCEHVDPLQEGVQVPEVRAPGQKVFRLRGGVVGALKDGTVPTDISLSHWTLTMG